MNSTLNIHESALRDGAKIAIGETVMKFKIVPKMRKAVVPSFEGMVGESPAMKKVYEVIQNAAPSDSRVLITGESGTGKELVARAIHRLSKRAGRTFRSINCAAIAKDLIDSELFGHEKGAFTGAHEMRKGAFEDADGGTIFLDEIGELQPELQAKLLRAIGEGEITRVGSTRPVKVNVRLIAATNRNLETAVKTGEFREDLYFRLKVIRIDLPALRYRGDDVLLLADAFMARMCEGRELGETARKKLKLYDWPGNVRELEYAIERAAVLSKTAIIGQEALDLEQASLDERVVRLKPDRPGRTLDEIEKEAILCELERQDGHRERTAKILGIGVSTLREKLKAWKKDEKDGQS